MRVGLLFCFILVFQLAAFAQTPQKMSYQAVIRNAAGNLITNSTVKMRISILQGTASGNSIFSEQHTITTNANGLATLDIGGGTATIGSFSAINWGNDAYFLKTETDPTGGNNYTITGISQLLSVPYALLAQKTQFDNVQDGDTSFWKFNGTKLYYTREPVNVGIGTNNPSDASILHLESTNKGLLLPRIALITTTSAAPLPSHTAGIIVYNTATANDVTPGIYYNDGSKWQALTFNPTALQTQINDLQTQINQLKAQLPIKRAIFVAGQSNTHWGTGSVTLPSDFDAKGMKQLGRGSVNLQEVPLSFYNVYHHSQKADGGSFGSMFCYYYYNELQAANPGRPIKLLLIPCGAGGSGWANSQYPNNSWRTDASYWNDVVARIKWAKEQGYQIDAFLWHQGETDADALTKNYKDILHNLIQSVRDQVEDPKLPFILGEMVPSWVSFFPSGRAPYQAIINGIPNEVPYTFTVSGSGLSLSDDIHYSAQAQYILGQRYYNGFTTAKQNQNPAQFSKPATGEYLVLNHNSSGGSYFADFFTAFRNNETTPTNALHSKLGDIWKYRNADGNYRFKLQVVNGSGISGGVFEWKQKINPFGLNEFNTEDRNSFVILQNTIGLNVTGAQGFKSLVYDSGISGGKSSLFHADTRSSSNLWWFAVGQTGSFSNLIPIVETNNSVNHIRLWMVVE